jgi:hypothetical protein
VIRVPTEEEEKLRHVHQQREALVRHRTKLQAQGRGLMVNHSQAAPPHWWRTQTWHKAVKAPAGLAPDPDRGLKTSPRRARHPESQP